MPCRLKFAIAVMAEMLGVLIFAFYSSSAPAEYAAWANGLSLAVVGETNDVLHISSCKAIQVPNQIHNTCGLLTDCEVRCLASSELHHVGVQAKTLNDVRFQLLAFRFMLSVRGVHVLLAG